MYIYVCMCIYVCVLICMYIHICIFNHNNDDDNNNEIVVVYVIYFYFEIQKIWTANMHFVEPIVCLCFGCMLVCGCELCCIFNF